MKLSAILAPLIAAKVPHDQIMAVVLAFESEQSNALEHRREVDRERQARKRSRDVTLRHSDGGLTGGDAHVEDKTSNSEIEPLKKVKSAKRARFDADMPLPVEWHDWAIKRGLPPERVPVEFEKIRNWAANATGDKGLKSDWFRAWQNWVIGAIDNLPRNRAPPPRTNAALAAADALMEKFDAVSPSQTEADPPYPRLVALTGR